MDMYRKVGIIAGLITLLVGVSSTPAPLFLRLSSSIIGILLLGICLIIPDTSGVKTRSPLPLQYEQLNQSSSPLDYQVKLEKIDEMILNPAADEQLIQSPRHGRAGPRDHRDAHPLGRDRLRHRRLRRGPRAARGDRGRDGRLVRRHPGAAHEPGAAQADGRGEPLEHGAHLHEPAAREDRGHVRQSGDDARWPRPQVLRQRPA